MKRSDDPALDLRAMQAAFGLEPDEPEIDPARLREFDEATAYWAHRFAPLLDLADPLVPSEALWRRIAADTMERVARSPATVAEPSWLERLWSSLGLWRLATAAALAAMLALVLLGPQLWRSPEKPALVAVLLAPGEQRAGFLVEVAADRTVRLTPLGETPVPSGRALQFWTKADADPGPTSLGLVPGNATTRVAFPKGLLGPGQLFEVTLEPEGGSTIGRPTGPILFIGRAVVPAEQRSL